jgi:glycosyltransferase involved in cell wall biosynthesis
MSSPDSHAERIEKKLLLSSLSVVFPAYNEEGNIRRTVESCRNVLDSVARKWEIIVANDGSRDRTGEICEALAAEDERIHVVHHPTNFGYGAALKSGIEMAKHDFIFFSDSDGQFDLEELKHFAGLIIGYHIVAGYRVKRQDPPYRLLNAWGWRMLARLVLGIKIRDIDCAFKLFRRSVFERVQIRSVGAMVNTEILAQTSRFGMRIIEAPVSHYPRTHGSPTGAKLRVIIKAFRELFGLWFKLRRISHEQVGLYPKPDGSPMRTSIELRQT